MAILNPEAQVRDDMPFLKSTFMVTVGAPFTSYLDIIKYAGQDELFGGPGNPQLSPAMQSILGQGTGSGTPLPVYFSRRKCRDTSLGGNDAINCYYQFCETDDPMHPFTETDYGLSGLGRAYSEFIDDNQQIMYISFGLPEFNSVSSFYRDSVIPQLADIMNKGSSSTGSQLGYLLGSTATTFLMLPAIPLLFLNRLLGGLTRTSITKYYDFASKMPLYYRCVNSILAHLAINLGLANDGLFLKESGTSQTGSKVSDQSWAALYRQSQSENPNAADGTGLPEVFQKCGFDIYKIMLRKYMFQKDIGPGDMGSTDQTLLETVNSSGTSTGAVADGNVQKKTWTEQLFNQFTGALYDAQLYVGFRVEKSVDTSESVSNQTGTSEIAQTLNSKVQAARSFSFSTMSGNLSDGAVGNAVEGILGAVTGAIKGAADVTGLSGITSVLTGSGFIDIPEVWTGSSFSKSYNFTLKLWSPYGDNVSIMQSIYVPLAMLLAGALPRAIGPSAYTSPFVCRAYCKGMFAVPLGLIESMTIQRGGDQYGWNKQKLPTHVTVTFAIKDLSPAMYLAVGDGGTWEALKDVFGQNSSFQEYLLTLSGMGLAERTSWYENFKRKFQILIQTTFLTKLNPNYWGMEAGYSTPGRVISLFMPTTKVPRN